LERAERKDLVHAVKGFRTLSEGPIFEAELIIKGVFEGLNVL